MDKIATAITIANPGLVDSDPLKLYLMKFGGEVLTAYTRSSKTLGRHIEKSISSGKSAQFPVFGRATAKYLKAGENLDDLRTNITSAEVTIVIDGLLTSDCLIFDLDEQMAHYDISGEYTKQIGEALAFARDGGVLAELAKEALEDELIDGLGAGGVLTKTLAPGETIGENEATGTAIYNMLLEMTTKLDNNSVPGGDRVVYMLPKGVNSLIASKDTLNKDFGALMTIVEGTSDVIRLLGYDIVKTPYLTEGGVMNADGSLPDGVLQGEGHAFPAAYKDSAMFVAGHRTSVGTLALKNMTIEKARRANYQADQIIVSYALGHGGLRPESAFIGVVNEAS